MYVTPLTNLIISGTYFHYVATDWICFYANFIEKTQSILRIVCSNMEFHSQLWKIAFEFCPETALLSKDGAECRIKKTCSRNVGENALHTIRVS